MLTLNNLKNLPVYTKNGQLIGRIADIEIDIKDQSILHYQVIITPRLLGLWKNRLLISPAQVISITNKEMIVEDLVGSDKLPLTETPTANN